MYDPNASPLIEAANRQVYELEAEAASMQALYGAPSTAIVNQLNAAQAYLEGRILDRTTAQGAVS